MSQLKNGTLLHGGTYKIEKVLGQGSFGITYLAEHTALGKKVAIKEFFMKELNSRGDDGSITGLSDGSLSYNYAQKFRKEAQNLARMEHPNIVRVTDSFDENGTFYYIMEYIDGMNLNYYIKRYTPSEKTAVEIIKEVAVALQYMHEEKHMLHLDLKPGNIMRRKGDGHIFLIDFGLSKHYDTSGAPETSTTIGLGTAGYAPIEQANQAKNGEFRPTIDVYALGATLYKLLTRETPPAASELVTDDELISDKLKECGISKEVSNVVVKAMLPNVRKRTQTIKEFVVFLQSSTPKQPSVKKEDEAEDNEKTLIVGGSAPMTEETEVIKPKEKTTHPDFKESSYKIDGEYIKFPTVTKNKADGGDEEAILALGMMALRGEGVRQDFDTAHGWFLKLKNLGDDRGEKLVGQWNAIKNKYSKQEPEITQEEETEESNGNSYGFLVGFICVVIVIIVIFACTKGCDNQPTSTDDYNIVYDTTTVVEDTVVSGPIFQDDNNNGYHEITYNDGATYKGYFKDGKRSGKGTYTSKDYIYEGNWENDMQNGYGDAQWPNEKRKDWMCEYRGNFKNGKMTGKGEAFYVGYHWTKGKFKDGECISVIDEGTWSRN